MAFEGLSRGDRITSESLLELARSVAALLVAGPGIEIKRVSGDKIIVSAAARRSLGDRGFIIPVYATPAALPLTGNTVPSLAYVTSTKSLYVWTDDSQWEPMNRLVDVTP